MNNWYRIMIKNAEEIKDRILYIMRSPSCAGKSTLAQELGKGGVVFSTDDFFMKDGKYVFNPKLLGTAHKWNFNRAKQAMDRSISPVVIDNTNTTLREMHGYVRAAKDHGYEIKFTEPNWNPELRTQEGKWNFDFIRDLQARRGSESGKKVPEEAVKRMIDRYEYRNPDETDEELADRILHGGGYKE